MGLVDLTCLLSWSLPGWLGCPTPIGGHYHHLLAVMTTTQLEFGLFDEWSISFL